MRSPLLLLAAASLAAAGQERPAPPQGHDPARSVVILVNEAVPDSVAVGEYYAYRRGIPSSQICRVRTVASEICSWPQLRSDILAPLAKFLESRPDVLFIVPTYGIPLKTSEEKPANDGRPGQGDALAQFVTGRDYCCVDREIELLRVEHEIEGWIPSKLFNLERPVTREDGVYLVSRLDGPTPEEARALVDSALYGEAYGVDGTSLVDSRGLAKEDPGAQIDAEIANCAKAFAHYGVPFTHDEGPEVIDLADRPGQAHYWGWYTGSIACSREGWRFNPGAVGAHLHSFSAAELRVKDRYWTGPLVHHGVAGTCGTVYEPLGAGFPIGVLFFDRFLRGATFGESMAMATRFTSWMAVYVGDPLYAPYAPWAKERQAKNLEVARRSYAAISAALDAGETARADDAARELAAIGVPYRGALDCTFLIRETKARLQWPDRKAGGSVAELKEFVDAARAMADAGNHKGALPVVKRALELSPVNYEANILSARCALETGSGKDAIEPLELARRIEPSFEVHFLRGRALRAAGRGKEAVGAFDEALALRFDLECTRQIGEVLMEAKDYAGAIRRLEDAYERRPTEREIAGELGRACIGVKEWSRAVAVLENAVKDLPRTTSEVRDFAGCYELLMAAVRGEGKDRARVQSLTGQVRDLKSSRVKPPSRKQAAEIDDRVDEILGTAEAGPLPPLPALADSTPGLPRLQLANRSAVELEVLVSGPVSFRRTLKPSVARGPERPLEIDLHPGLYRVVLIRAEGGKRIILRREQRFEVGSHLALVVDPEFKLVK